MVYRRYYRRRTTRARRARTTKLSRYNTYRHRSSAAQASQIYNLARRMNRIQRLTKPEIKIAPLVQGQMLSTDGTTSNGTQLMNPVNLTNLLPQGTTATGGNVVLDGRFARIQNITLKGLFTYNTSTDTDVDLQRMVSYMRIVIVQTKATRGQFITSSDVWPVNILGTDSTLTATNLLPFAQLRAPLRPGLARICKVLSDKTYMLSDTRQAVNIKTKLRYVRPWYKTPTEDGPKGQVMMFVMMLNQQYEDADNVNTTSFNFVSKLAYTDA